MEVCPFLLFGDVAAHPLSSSNGVQIGDIGSAKGVIGVWTTTIHEQGASAQAPSVIILNRVVVTTGDPVGL